METRRPLQRRTALRSATGLRAVPSSEPIDFAAARAARDAKAADRAAQRALDRSVHPIILSAVEDREDHFPATVKKLIIGRGDGRCELAGWDVTDCWGPVSAHHRMGTGAGGSTNPIQHVASNGIGACQAHHSYAHGHPLLSRGLGIILLRNSVFTDPAAESVSFNGGRTRVWLTDSGDYAGCAPEADGGDAA